MELRAFRTTLLLIFLAFAGHVMAQDAYPQPHTQTLRGTILDADTQQPIYAATVAVIGTEPPMSATTDFGGRFEIANVPTGRVDLRVRAMGFEEQLLPNVLLVSGKEKVLKLMMVGSVTQMEEVEIKATKPNGELRNDMATLSARRISVEETSRIAGGINDPARMVSAFPGVAGDATGDNSIVVRGNSPTGVLWRLEGMEIPNPNHFSDDGSTGGPINVLNSDMLDDSEFYTGAFAPEYGNATSAVFDMRLRDGNDKEREYTLKAGVLGTDLTAEGPLPGVAGGSYLANFRYSTLALLDDAGIVDFGGVPQYTDAAFKLKVPTKGAGTFTLFGLGGKSHIIEEDEGVTGDTLFSRADFGSRMGVLGLTNTKLLGENSYVYSTVSLSGNGSSTEYDETDSPGEQPLERHHTSDLAKWTVRASTTLNNKLSAKHKLRSGLIVSSEQYRMSSASYERAVGELVTDLDTRGQATTLQAFTSWKWRWDEQWSMTSGVHVLHYTMNGATSVEPRLGLRYQMHPGRAITFGSGLHSRTEALMTYTVQVPDAQGTMVQPNGHLGLSKAFHLVAGYEHMLAEDLQLKGEVYYQHLFDMPVEDDPTSSFSLANSGGWYTDRRLVNAGKGRNMGVELSLEKFFTRGYHFLATASIMDAHYTALDGVWHNSRFNMGFVGNVLAGKEWKLSSEKDRVLTTGFRYSVLGGQYSTPIDLEASIAAGEQKDGEPVWSVKGDPIHKLDMVVSYRVGRAKVSHEFKADVQNVLGAQTAVYKYFDERTGTIKDVPQLNMLPVLQYTLRF